MRAVLLDMGGVLVELGGERPFLEMIGGGIGPEEMWRRWLASPSVRAHETGRLDSRAFAEQAVRALERAVEPAREMLEEFRGAHRQAELANRFLREDAGLHAARFVRPDRRRGEPAPPHLLGAHVPADHLEEGPLAGQLDEHAPHVEKDGALHAARRLRASWYFCEVFSATSLGTGGAGGLRAKPIESSQLRMYCLSKLSGLSPTL